MVGKQSRSRGLQKEFAAFGLSSNTYRNEEKSYNAIFVNPSQALGGFPDKVRTTMRYVERLSLTSTSGAANSYVYRGNSLYDPNASGTGGQPNNFDDYAVHFNRYRVLGSTFKISAYPSTSTYPGGMAELVILPSNATVGSGIEDLLSEPYAMYGVTSQSGLILGQFMSTKKILGQDPMTADRCQSINNTNPDEVWEWLIYIQSLDRTSTATAYIEVVIDYHCEWFDRLPTGLDSLLKRAKVLSDAREARMSRASLLSKEVSDSKESESSLGEDFVELQSSTPPKLLRTPHNSLVSNRALSGAGVETRKLVGQVR
jgi:hypothetical protein